MRRRRLALAGAGAAAGAVLATAALAGGDAAGSPRRTRAAFVAQADELCDRASLALVPPGEELDGPATVAYLIRISDVGRALVDALAALPTPEGDEEAVALVVSAMASGSSWHRAAAEAAAAGDLAGMHHGLGRAEALARVADARAGAYGFSACAARVPETSSRGGRRPVR